jgi:hypothetical protein
MAGFNSSMFSIEIKTLYCVPKSFVPQRPPQCKVRRYIFSFPGIQQTSFSK